MSPMPVGKQVFLLGIGAITTVMSRMTPAVTTVKKAAVGGKKSPAGAGTKTAALKGPLPGPPKAHPQPSEKPLPSPPQGAGVHSRCVLGGWVARPPFGEGWGGAYTRGGSPFSLCFRRLGGTPSLWGGLGRGFREGLLVGWAGLSLNTIIPASTWTDGNDLWVNYEKCIDAAMLNSILGGCSFHRNVRCAMYQLRCYLHLYKSCNT